MHASEFNQIMGFLCPLAIFGLIIVAIILIAKASSQAGIRTTFQRLAARFNGTVVYHGLARRPALHFRYRGVSVVLESARRRTRFGRKATVLSLGWPDRGLDCEIFRASWLRSIGSLLGERHLRVDSPKFARNFWVFGDPPERVLKLLTAGVQTCFEQIQSSSESGVQLTVRGGVWTLMRPGTNLEENAMTAFVVRGLEMYDQALLAQSAEIDFQVQASVPDRPAVCKICGDEIQRDVVYCAECHTPHHLECWQYNGKCSTYACGTSRYVTTRKMSRLA